MKAYKKLIIVVAVLILLSPLGLILPEYFKAGSAWGEWSTEEIHQQVGYTPQGMQKHGESWNAPMPDYAFRGQDSAPVQKLSISYIVSGIVGAGAVVLISLGLGKLLAKNAKPEHS